MTNEQYRAAFSKIQPSEEAVDRLLAIPTEQPKPRRRIRLGALIAAAAVVVLLLGGTVYAASHWFRLTDGSQIKDPNGYESGEPTRSAPQNGISLEDQGEGNYIGFTLDGWTLPDRKQGVNNIMLKNVVDLRSSGAQSALDPDTFARAYTQYYPILPDGEMLCVQVLDRDGLGYRDYFTRYKTELVKEGTMNGMETVWLTIQGEPEDTWHLFCRNDTLHCVLVVSSNRGFARCEEAISHLTMVDTGIPLNRGETLTVYGLRLPELPDGFEIDWEDTMLLENSMSGWERKDPDADLTGAYGYLDLVRPTDGLRIILGAEAHHSNYENVAGYQLNHIGDINGQKALWFDETTGGTALVYWHENGSQALLYANDRGTEVEALLTELALRIEPVPMNIVKLAPLEFTGLAQG